MCTGYASYCALCPPKDMNTQVPLDMSRIHPECCNPSDQLVVAGVFLRQEPDDAEDEGDRKKDDDDREDNGYSE